MAHSPSRSTVTVKPCLVSASASMRCVARSSSTMRTLTVFGAAIGARHVYQRMQNLRMPTRVHGCQVDLARGGARRPDFRAAAMGTGVAAGHAHAPSLEPF